MRALLVVNPESRHGEEAARFVDASLRAHGIVPVDAIDEEAGTPEPDCIVSAGGDGTLTRVIPLAIRHNVPVGVVPLGTFNELARTLGVPLALDAAIAAIAGGHTRTIDVARVNGVYYISEASIGISSRAARYQTPAEKKRFGVLAVIGTALRALRHSRPMHVEVRFDGKREQFKTVQLTVANSHRFGGIFNVANAAVDDGWLDLYSVEIDNAIEAFALARAVLSGNARDVPGLRTFRSTSFHVRTRHAHRISADGEPAGLTPATFEILPQALRVYVPASAPA